MDTPLQIVSLITALGCALNGGVFFAFSSFVMKGLARLHPAQAIAAMQSINVAAVTPAFMTALCGTAVGCVIVTAWAMVEWHASVGPYLLAAGGLYLLGTLGLTIVVHVPRNNRLATIRPDRAGRAEATLAWSGFLSEWTAFNHVRAATAFAAGLALILALVAS